MLDWLKLGGSEFPKVKMRYYSDNYRGVHASQNIKSGETFIFVPLHQIITLEMAFRTPIGKQMYEKGLRNKLISPKHSFLGSYILQERKKDHSDFDTYLDILPKGLREFPIFFGEDEYKFLKGSPFLDQIKEKNEDIKIDYDLICKEVPDFEQFTLDEYKEVRILVSSRIFGITVNGVKTDGFVPLADMLNHRRPKQSSWYFDDNRQGFVIEATEDILRGEQIYDSYGRKCNSRFFLNYGFINPNNDANEVPIYVKFSQSDPGYDIKVKLRNDRKDFQKFRVVDNLHEQVMNDFLGFIRYQSYDGDLAYLYLAKNNAN